MGMDQAYFVLFYGVREKSWRSNHSFSGTVEDSRQKGSSAPVRGVDAQ
jgi:hypothetical protein